MYDEVKHRNVSTRRKYTFIYVHGASFVCLLLNLFILR